MSELVNTRAPLLFGLLNGLMAPKVERKDRAPRDPSKFNHRIVIITSTAADIDIYLIADAIRTAYPESVKSIFAKSNITYPLCQQLSCSSLERQTARRSARCPGRVIWPERKNDPDKKFCPAKACLSGRLIQKR